MNSFILKEVENIEIKTSGNEY